MTMRLLQRLASNAQRHSLVAGISANLLSEIGRAALLPAIAIVAARYLGADQYGVFATGQALMAFAATFGGFGLLHAVLLIGARQEEPLSDLLTHSLVGALATALLAYGGVAIWIWTFNYDASTNTVVLIMAMALLPMAANAQLTSGLQVQGRYTLIAAAGFLAAVVNVAYALFVVAADLGLNWLAVTPVVASCTVTVAMAIGLRREFRLRLDPTRVIHLFRTGFLFGLGDFLYFIYFSIDMILLSIMVGERDVGFYNIPVRILVVVYLVPTVLFSRVLYSRYVDWNKSDPARLRSTHLMMTKGMTVAGLLCAALLIIVANPIIPFVFGDEFSDSSALLRILALAVPLRYIAGSPSVTLAATGNIGSRVRIQGATAVLNIVLCLALIPALGATGAAISTVITELFLGAALILVVRRTITGVDVVKEARLLWFALPFVLLVVGAIGPAPTWVSAGCGLGAIAALLFTVRVGYLADLMQPFNRGGFELAESRA